LSDGHTLTHTFTHCRTGHVRHAASRHGTHQWSVECVSIVVAGPQFNSRPAVYTG